MAIDYRSDAVREVVAVFHEAERFESAIDELLSSGFDRAGISLLASEQAVENKLGHRFAKTSDLMDEDDVPRSAFVSSAAIGDAEGALIGGLAYVGATVAAGAVVVAGGALTATIAAALIAGGSGGLLGSVLANWVGQHHADYLDKQIDRGGLLLWVRAWSAAEEKRAAAIMRKYCGGKVHVHVASAEPDSPARLEVSSGR
jgi:hypothetical protein